jgi:hypothetical protein
VRIKRILCYLATRVLLYSESWLMSSADMFLYVMLLPRYCSVLRKPVCSVAKSRHWVLDGYARSQSIASECQDAVTEWCKIAAKVWRPSLESCSLLRFGIQAVRVVHCHACLQCGARNSPQA